ncbi:hypothetical protein DFJ58DRAFT_731660 [Suillus subalutaceus]|uniref:uncharacterized protein n=1 Tax=Suillus subalutaceus TaxID=48586 RepID=UPI001B881DEB|nr:uncharacterized protein DFJ58DRAFT_731660 [Suillus subalutaceus]KAG1843368.1 hypothetical protein DFJ58DRAFT_731660 [Suillus subalutaceus]
MSSSELQYIVEMSGQRLLPVPNTGNSIPVAKRLQLLRDKAHAWFSVDIHSSETVLIARALRYWEAVIADGHFYLWSELEDTATIFPILPKPSQQSIQRKWLPGTLCSVPDSCNLDVFMDPVQNLIAVAYFFDDTVYISLGALDSDGVHPQAAGERLILSDNSENPPETIAAKLIGLGRHIALWRTLDNSSLDEQWQLQIWDWQHSTTSGSILSGTSDSPLDIRFLGNNQLLVITDNLDIYLIEDMSQMPELLACFLMPVPLMSSMLRSLLPTDDIGHSSQPQIQAQRTMYTSDPTHRLICLTTSSSSTDSSSSIQVFIISTRIFFDLDGMAATPIPWQHWGPSNTRVFQHPYQSQVHISGNRVLQALPVGTRNSEFILHLMDFSPLAATNRRGLGQVVKEPSTIYIGDSTGRSGESLTTSLPYVQVAFLDRKFDSARSELRDMWIDKDRIYILNLDLQPETFPGDRVFVKRPIVKLEVIDV